MEEEEKEEEYFFDNELGDSEEEENANEVNYSTMTMGRRSSQRQRN